MKKNSFDYFQSEGMKKIKIQIMYMWQQKKKDFKLKLFWLKFSFSEKLNFAYTYFFKDQKCLGRNEKNSLIMKCTRKTLLGSVEHCQTDLISNTFRRIIQSMNWQNWLVAFFEARKKKKKKWNPQILIYICPFFTRLSLSLDKELNLVVVIIFIYSTSWHITVWSTIKFRLSNGYIVKT